MTPVQEMTFQEIKNELRFMQLNRTLRLENIAKKCGRTMLNSDANWKAFRSNVLTDVEIKIKYL